jgi:hypothetical protein
MIEKAVALAVISDKFASAAGLFHQRGESLRRAERNRRVSAAVKDDGWRRVATHVMCRR